MDPVRPWGHKATIVVYVAGSADHLDATIHEGLRALTREESAEFVGVSIEAVEDEPKDQGHA